MSSMGWKTDVEKRHCSGDSILALNLGGYGFESRLVTNWLSCMWLFVSYLT
jgi:hypothetical protein